MFRSLRAAQRFCELCMKFMNKWVNNSQSVCCATSPAEWSLFLWGIDSLRSPAPTSPVSKRDREDGEKSIMLLHLFYQISTTFQNISLISLGHFPDSNRGMHPTQLLTDREAAFILTHFNPALIQKRLNLALQHLCVKVGQRFNSSGHMPRGHS